MTQPLASSQSSMLPSDRIQIMIDAEIDDRLSNGERLPPEELSRASELQITLLRQCGLRHRRGYYQLPKNED